MSTVAITGSNRGIGLALALAYLKRGDTVFAICRSAGSAVEHPSLTFLEGVDVTEREARQRCFQELSDRLDLDNSGQFWHANGARLPW